MDSVGFRGHGPVSGHTLVFAGGARSGTGSAMEVKLIVNTGPSTGRVLTLKHDETLIGRMPGCGLRLKSPEVSRRHCRIRVSGDLVSVADLGSTNGTFVNGHRITHEVRLLPGDRLRVGPVEFVVHYVREVESRGAEAPQDACKKASPPAAASPEQMEIVGPKTTPAAPVGAALTEQSPPADVAAARGESVAEQSGPQAPSVPASSAPVGASADRSDLPFAELLAESQVGPELAGQRPQAAPPASVPGQGTDAPAVVAGSGTEPDTEPSQEAWPIYEEVPPPAEIADASEGVPFAEFILEDEDSPPSS